MMEYTRFNEVDKNIYYEEIDPEREHVKKATKNAFKRIEDYELSHKMIHQMRPQEILELYKFLNNKNIALNTILNTHSVLKMYVDSYIYSHSLKVKNNLESISNRQLKELFIKEKSVKRITYSELHKKLELLPNPSDQFILLGLFEGVMGKTSYCELCYASLEHADYRTKKIWLASVNPLGEVVTEGRNYQASNKLYAYAEKATTTYQYTSLETGQTYALSGKEIVKPRIHYSEHEKQDLQTRKALVGSRIRNILDFLEWGSFSASDVYWSGVWYNLQIAGANNNIKDMNEVFKCKSYQKIKEQYNLSNRVPDVKQSLRTRGYL